MNKYCLLLLPLFFLPTHSNAQSYTPLIREGVDWYISYHHTVECFPFGCCGITRYYFEGDTSFNNKGYHIMYAQHLLKDDFRDYPCDPPYTVGNPQISEHFLREDTATGRVYRYSQGCHDDETLLFDFKAQAGDTLRGYCLQNTYTLVDSVSKVMLKNGEERKIFYLGEFATNWYIEGIGGVNGPFFYPEPFQGPGWDYECVRENGLNVWGDACNNSLSVYDQVRLRPKVSLDFTARDITISLPNSQLATYQLLDLQGREITEGEFREGVTLKLPKTSTGILLLCIRQGKQVFSRKIPAYQ
jgi:hypothetical protein